MIEICPKEHCSGCSACLNICPKNAIKMTPDICGFMYPEIDQELCIECGLCQKVCPVVHSQPQNESRQAFAAHSLDEIDRMTSTSGGAASVFSHYILRKGGVVYGCSGEDCMYVRHIRVTDACDLWKLKGSKYVQSEIGFILQDIKSDLQNGKLVLFTGTPCQVAGLKGFLCKEYENLITIDLVCHGVPSQQLLNDHIHHITNGNGMGCQIKFRQNENYAIILKKENTLIYTDAFPQDIYLFGFINKLFLRDSCENCCYASPARVSDITIGDFWGLKNTSIDIQKGVSLLLTNNDKGYGILNNCKHLFYIEEHKTFDAIQGNGHLQKASPISSNNKLFKYMYSQKGFSEACAFCLKYDYKRYRRMLIIKFIVKVIANVPFSKRIYHVLKK